MIDRLRELLRAATDAPWYILDDGYLSTDPDRWADAALLAWDHDGLGQSWRNKADARLIVEAVNALPELLDAHDRMAGALAKAERLNAMLPDELARLADLLEAKVPLPSNRTDYFEGWLDAVRAVREELLAVRDALAVPKEENPDVPD